MAGSLINPTGLTKSMFVAPDLPDKVDTTGFANTMMALQDPAGTLSRKQNEQIAETTAGMTLDGLQGDILNAGFRDWDNYKTKYKDYLSSNKGFARLRLNEQQKAEMDREKQKLSANVWWGKKVQQNFIDVLKQARVDAGEGKIDPAELQAFEDKWVDLVKNNKGGLGDLPMPESLYNNMVHPKPKNEDLTKKQEEFYTLLSKGQIKGKPFNEEKANVLIDGLPDQLKPKTDEAKQSLIKQLKARHEESVTGAQAQSIYIRERSLNDSEAKAASAEARTKAKTEGVTIPPKYDVGNNMKTWDVGSYNIPFNSKVYVNIGTTQKPKMGWITGKGHVEQIIDKDGGKTMKVVVADPKNKGKFVEGTAEYQADVVTKMKQIGKGVHLDDFDKKEKETQYSTPDGRTFPESDLKGQWQKIHGHAPSDTEWNDFLKNNQIQAQSE